MRHGSFVPHDVTCARTHRVSPLLTLKWLELPLSSLTLTFLFSCMHIKFCDATVNNIYILWCKHDWFDAVSVGKIIGLKFRTPTTCCIVDIIYCREKSCTSITWFFFLQYLVFLPQQSPFLPMRSPPPLISLSSSSLPSQCFSNFVLGPTLSSFSIDIFVVPSPYPPLNFLRNDMGGNSSFLYAWKLVFYPDIGLTM